MRGFLFFTASFIVGAIVATAAVFWYVQTALLVPTSERVEQGELGMPEPGAATATPPAVGTSSPESRATSTAASDLTDDGTEPIPLSEVELTPQQRALAESLGIDPESFVIRPAMIECARVTLGDERFAEIQSGDSPGPLETARLLPCLRSDTER